jgi:hypothetical protein
MSREKSSSPAAMVPFSTPRVSLGRCFFRFQVSGFGCQRRRWPRASNQIEKETNEHRTLNVQHRTSNNVFCPFKIKPEQAYSAEMATMSGSKTTLRNSIRLPRTGYIRPELMSKAGLEPVEGYSSQAADQYSTRLSSSQATVRLS